MDDTPQPPHDSHLQAQLDAMLRPIEEEARKESPDGTLPIGWHLKPLTEITLSLMHQLEIITGDRDGLRAAIEWVVRDASYIAPELIVERSIIWYAKLHAALASQEVG